MTGDTSRFRAFISYSWKDKSWANRLHHWLEGYRTPLDPASGRDMPRSLGKFFRDDADMAAGEDIGAIVRDAIARSDHLIVVCSPSAAQSQWVRAEIEEFRRVRPDGRIFAVIVDGAPNAANPVEECFPPQLRKALTPGAPDAMPVEPVGVDLRRDGRDRTCVRLAAGLLGVDFDALWQRDRRRAEARQRRRLATLGVLSATFAALLVVALVNARAAHVALSRFFAERAWQSLDDGEALTAARYALAGAQLAPQNEPLYGAALGAVMQASGESMPVAFHPGGAAAAIFSRDGALLLTGGADRIVHIRRVRNASPVATLQVSAPVTAASFAPDATRAAVADASGVITVWDVATGRALATLKGHQGAVVALAFRADGLGLLSLGEDHMIRLWDVASGRAVTFGDGAPVWTAKLSPDGRLIASGREDGAVVLYDAVRATAIARLKGHDADVYALAFSPDGARLVSAGADARAVVWDVRSRRRVATLRGHALEIFDVAFSPDGQRIVTASVDQTARLWNAADGAPVATLRGHVNHVTHALFTPDGDEVVTAGRDGAARVWDARDGALLTALRGHSGAITALDVSPDGAAIMTAGRDGRVRLWAPRASGLSARLALRGRTVHSVEFADDGATLIAADDRGEAHSWTRMAWTAARDAPPRSLAIPMKNVRAMVLSPDGRFFAAAGDTGVRLFDRQGAPVRTFSEDPAAVAAFSRDGARLIGADDAGLAHIWRVGDGGLVATLRGHEDAIRSAAFSPDGRQVATSSEDARVRLWDAATGKSLAALAEHRLGVGGVVFAPDGLSLLTTSDDGVGVLWDARTHAIRLRLAGHRGGIYSAAFSPDGRRIATASEDGAARIWDARDGRTLAIFDGGGKAVFGVAFSPDAALLAAGGEDGVVRVWNVRRLTQAWKTLASDACDRLLGNEGQHFSAADIQSDALLAAEWPRRSRAVCKGRRG